MDRFSDTLGIATSSVNSEGSGNTRNTNSASASNPTGSNNVAQSLLTKLRRAPHNTINSAEFRRELLSYGYRQPLDRVNELEGHRGCVNALSWAQDGKLLLSGGDDRTVRIWRMDTEEDWATPYPFKCDAILQTPHKGNIFNVQLLPGSTKIATVAADGLVCVFDAERAINASVYGGETEFSSSQACIQIFRCHDERTKRIVTEESADLFLSVAEDGTVRQHDLRVKHQCKEHCPAPLLRLPHELSTLAVSPLAPHQIVVAGESPYGYLFDRRQMGRVLEEEWGVPCTSEDTVTCVRRLGRDDSGRPRSSRNDHITGVRMAQHNGHEVLLSYSSDAVYLYSTKDEPTSTNSEREPTTTLVSNSQESAKEVQSPSCSSSGCIDGDNNPTTSLDGEIDVQELMEITNESEDEEDEEEGREEENLDDAIGLGTKFRTPIVLPRARFVGARNERTIKDVNFIGPNDEFVVSGSDDGNFFIWDKYSTNIHGIYEGDGAVVNVIEGHPQLPLLAVSGIDYSVKLFAPTTSSQSEYSRLGQKDHILEENSRFRPRPTRMNIQNILRLHGFNEEFGNLRCTYQ